MNRHLSRMIAMQTIYEADFRDDAELSEVKARNLKEYEGKADEEFCEDLITKIIDHNAEIDKTITKCAPEWPLDQISLIDKSILRLSICELLYSKEVPPKVVINEAVELGKEFGGENSSKFINGVLGTVYEANNLGGKKKKDE